MATLPEFRQKVWASTVDKNPGQDWFFSSKLVLYVYEEGVNAKKMAEKGEKQTEKKGIFWLFSRLPQVKIWGLPIVKTLLF